MTALELFQRAAALGLRIESRGEKLAVSPADRVPPQFADELRQHKRELLDWLEHKSAVTPLDCISWLHVSRQILAGEFDGADCNTRQNLTFGLRCIEHPLCKRALKELAP